MTPGQTSMHFGAGTPKAMDGRTTCATPACDHQQPDALAGENCLRAHSASPYLNINANESEQAHESGVAPARALSPEALRFAQSLAAASLQYIAARQAAADGAPFTVSDSMVRRGMAHSSETPAGVALRAPAGLVAGGDLAIAYTVSPKSQNGRGSHAELI